MGYFYYIKKLFCLFISFVLVVSGFPSPSLVRAGNDRNFVSENEFSKENIHVVDVQNPIISHNSITATSLDKLSGETIVANFECLDEYPKRQVSVFNLSDGCTGYKIDTTGSLSVEFKLNKSPVFDEIHDSAIKVFHQSTAIAAANIIKPIDTYFDRKNKKAIATLKEKSGHYFVGVLKPVDGVGKSPQAFSTDFFEEIKKTDILNGIINVAPASTSQTGELNQQYKLSFPGARENLEPSVSINYTSKSGYGNIGEGWRLNVPSIAVDASRQVPVYDSEYETETYLFNGKQLVPVAEKLISRKSVRVQSQRVSLSEAIKLVKIPHFRSRTLRPRVTSGEARFVLRNDDGSLWNVVRLGSSPSNYTWQAWKENTGGKKSKILFFGRQPGKHKKFYNDTIEELHKAKNNQGSLQLGGATANPAKDARSNWNLTREVDAHGNIVDYEWELKEKPEDEDATPSFASRELLLRRVSYTGQRKFEEAIVECREYINPEKHTACLKKLTYYQMVFNWGEPNVNHLRMSASSGGMVVQSSLLKSIALVVRHNFAESLGHDFIWKCSSALQFYDFSYAKDNVTQKRYLTNIKKGVLFEPVSIKDVGYVCPSKKQGNDVTPVEKQGNYDTSVTRFSYDNSFGFSTKKDGKLISATIRAPFRQDAGNYDLPPDLTLLSKFTSKGPFNPSIGGTTSSVENSFSLYLGINPSASTKQNSFGFKLNHQSRIGYKDSVTMLDVTGNGIQDIIVAKGNKDFEFPDNSGYIIFPGALDSNGDLTFGEAQSVLTPPPSLNSEPKNYSFGQSIELHPTGGFLGVNFSKGSAIQDTFMLDANQDRCIDVAYRGTIHFNNCDGNGSLGFSTSIPMDGHVDLAYRSGVKGDFPIDEIKKKLEAELPSPDPKNSPQIDIVRSWRAPFTGTVIVTGDPELQIPLVSNADVDVEPVAQNIGLARLGLQESQDEAAKNADGVVVSLELNSERGVEDKAGINNICIVLELDKETPRKSLIDAAGDNDCVAPVLSDANLVDLGLPLSVKAGDILYFRVHSKENGVNDVVDWAPFIKYIKLDSRDLFTPFDVDETRLFDYEDLKGKELVYASLGIGSSNSISSECLEEFGNSPSGTLWSEAAFGFCDPWGNSYLRYQVTREGIVNVLSPGSFKIPYYPIDGKLKYTASYKKTITRLPLDLAYHIANEVSQCSPDKAVHHIASLEVDVSKELNGELNPITQSDVGKFVCLFMRTKSPDVFQNALNFPIQSNSVKWIEPFGFELERNIGCIDGITNCEFPSEIPKIKKDLIYVDPAYSSETYNSSDASSSIRIGSFHNLMSLDNLVTSGELKPVASAVSSLRLGVIKEEDQRKCVISDYHGEEVEGFEYRIKINGKFTEIPASTISKFVDPVHVNAPANQLRIAFGERRQNGEFNLLPSRIFKRDNSANFDLDDLLIDSGGGSALDEPGGNFLANEPGYIQDLRIASIVKDTQTSVVPNFFAEVSDAFHEIDDFGFSICIPSKEEDELRKLEVLTAYKNPVNYLDGTDLNSNIIDICRPSLKGSVCRLSQFDFNYDLGDGTIETSKLSFMSPRSRALEAQSYRGWSAIAATYEGLGAPDDLQPLQTFNYYLEKSQSKSGAFSTPVGIDAQINKFDTETGLNEMDKDDGTPADQQGLPNISEELNKIKVYPLMDQIRISPSDTLYSSPSKLCTDLPQLGENFKTPKTKFYNVINKSLLQLSLKETSSQSYLFAKSGLGKLRVSSDVEVGPHITTILEKSLVSESNQCLLGPDPYVWIKGSLMSSSRLGVKDLRNPISDNFGKFTSGGYSPGIMIGRVLPKISNSKAVAKTAGVYKATLSHSSSYNISNIDSFDFNNDGFSDQFANNQILLTDPLGHFRCTSVNGKVGPWSDIWPCASSAKNIGFERKTKGGSFGGTFGVFSYTKSIGQGRGGQGGNNTGNNTASSDTTTESQFGQFDITIKTGVSENTRISDFVDVNGDGLPDKVKVEGRGVKVQYNLGYGLSSSPVDLPNALTLLKNTGGNGGLGLSFGFGDERNGFGGGIALNMGLSEANEATADINGDGLIDRIRLERSEATATNENQETDSRVVAKFNLGQGGFSNDVEILSELALKQTTLGLGLTEQDIQSLGGYITIPIPLLPSPVNIIINPGANISSNVNRQVVSLKDVNSDGCPDIIVGESVLDNGFPFINNRKAKVYYNQFCKRGLLKHVYLPTNRQSLVENEWQASEIPLDEIDTPNSDFNVRPNYSYQFARAGSAFNNPMNHWVLNEIVVSDGVHEDENFAKTSLRRSCISYSDGQYDRFERKFLGFGKVSVVEGCNTHFNDRRKLQTPSKDTEIDNEPKGIRQIVSTYANGSIYEQGILLNQKTYDLTKPIEANGAKVANRELINDYALLDIAKSTHSKMYCYMLSSEPRHAAGLDFGKPVRLVSLTESANQSNVSCAELPTQLVKSTDISIKKAGALLLKEPLRLTPVLQRVRQINREKNSGADANIGTELNLTYDHFARVIKACDTGNENDGSEDDICSSVRYADNIILDFGYGATGGGTKYALRKDLAKSIKVFHSKSNRQLRSRSASYYSKTGDLAALCNFVDFSVADLCTPFAHFPSSAETLSNSGVAIQYFKYNGFGDLEKYMSPLSDDKDYMIREFKYDEYLHRTETSQITNYCGLNGAQPSDKLPCVEGHSSLLGEFISHKKTMDFRHAAFTSQIDVNRNATHSKFDGFGRPISVFGSWVEKAEVINWCWEDEENCSDLIKPGHQFGKLVEYSYKAHPTSITDVKHTPRSRIKQFVSDQIYGGKSELITDILYDQLGAQVQTITSAEICKIEEFDDSSNCEAMAEYAVSGITISDILNRPTQINYPVSVERLASTRPIFDDLKILPPMKNEPSTNSFYDGLDRPVGIELPDENSYKLAYHIKNVQGQKRHQTFARNAVCNVSGLARDIRGNITEVYESYNRDGNKIASGSRFDTQKPSNPFNLSVSLDSNNAQQMVKCDASFPENIKEALLGIGELQVSMTSYSYDALNQLSEVHLPNRKSQSPPKTSDVGIRVGYDNLGRRVWVDDPDKGLEISILDLLGNKNCSYSGQWNKSPPNQLSSLTELLTSSVYNCSKTDLENLTNEKTTPPNLLNGMNFEPDTLVRIIKSNYLYNLPQDTNFVFPIPFDGSRKNISLKYGLATAFENNAAGRLINKTDVTGVEKVISYNAVGQPNEISRTFKELCKKSLARCQRLSFAESKDVGTVTIKHEYDHWGLSVRKHLEGQFARLGSEELGAPIQQKVQYLYNTAGMMKGVYLEDGIREVVTQILKDVAYDERGNIVRTEHGNGVITRNRFANTTNRLIAMRARVGVEEKCSQLNPCEDDRPPIYFQNLAYRFDASGNVVQYKNSPRYVDEQPILANLDGTYESDTIPPNLTSEPYDPYDNSSDAPDAHFSKINREHAWNWGLLMQGSENYFTYDEQNRIQSAIYDFGSFGRTSNTWVMNRKEFDHDNALKRPVPPSRVIWKEDFSFSPSHEIQSIDTKAKGRILDASYDDDVTSQIDDATSEKFSFNNSQPYHAPAGSNYDQFGRKEKNSKIYGTNSSTNYWDPDDTLRNVKNYHYAYDSSGNRIAKFLPAQRYKSNSSVKDPASDTDFIYADSDLTVIRSKGDDPDYLIHVFAGGNRLASKWMNSDALFTYHAALQTQNITDVIHSNGDDSSSARIYQQIQYAAFGKMIRQRQRVLEEISANENDIDRFPQGNSAPYDDDVFGPRPVYRFNAKEYDKEIGLTYFGARYYDSDDAHWIKPDPILGQYLQGKPNGGVFAPKNLASYSFGWGNPISNIDEDGEAIFTAVALTIVGGAATAAAGAYLEKYGATKQTKQLGKTMQYIGVGIAGLASGVSASPVIAAIGLSSAIPSIATGVGVAAAVSASGSEGISDDTFQALDFSLALINPLAASAAVATILAGGEESKVIENAIKIDMISNFVLSTKGKFDSMHSMMKKNTLNEMIPMMYDTFGQMKAATDLSTVSSQEKKSVPIIHD